MMPKIAMAISPPYLKSEKVLGLAVPRIGRTHLYEKPNKVNYDKHLFARLKGLRKSTLDAE